MRLSEIRRVLEIEQIQLTKSLGQNFLHDSSQLARIIAAAELTDQTNVMEIGPGLGALTQRLFETARHVLAIEKDRRLFDFLRQRFGAEPRLTLVHADALDYLRRRDDDWSNWKLVSNLPYSAASSILVEFAKRPNPPERMTVTLQLEVAQRMAAAAGTEQYGVLTLLVQLRYQVTSMFRIPPGCFFPVPEIDSACVILERRPELPLGVEQVRAFEKIVKRGFSQRRKMMLKLLKADWPLPALESAFGELGILPQARAEMVTLAQFVQLTRSLAPLVITP
jgi:16S rRNA (adenine1518-N6/adenine1519-N6)-dimethyltransferase